MLTMRMTAAASPVDDVGEVPPPPASPGALARVVPLQREEKEKEEEDDDDEEAPEPPAPGRALTSSADDSAVVKEAVVEAEGVVLPVHTRTPSYERTVRRAELVDEGDGNVRRRRARARAWCVRARASLHDPSLFDCARAPCGARSLDLPPSASVRVPSAAVCHSHCDSHCDKSLSQSLSQSLSRSL